MQLKKLAEWLLGGLDLILLIIKSLIDFNRES